jgi:hypothetical protein
MRSTLFGLAINVAALLACGASGGTSWERARGGVVVVSCGRHTADCYNGAAAACPYGYQGLGHSTRTSAVRVTSQPIGNAVQTTVVPVQRGELTVKCLRPVFCETLPCESGFRCVVSKRKGIAGRHVCAIR